MAKKKIEAAVVIYDPSTVNDTVSNEVTSVSISDTREDLDSSGLTHVVNQHEPGGHDLSASIQFKFDDDLTQYGRVVEDVRTGAEVVYRFKMSDAAAASTNFWWDFKFRCLTLPQEFNRNQLLEFTADWPVNNMAYDKGAGFVFWQGSAI